MEHLVALAPAAAALVAAVALLARAGARLHAATAVAQALAARPGVPDTAALDDATERLSRSVDAPGRR